LAFCFSSRHSETWELTGSAIIPMNKNLFAGLVVTAHNNSVLNSTRFDNVSLTTH
jgi:hypothetical protein